MVKRTLKWWSVKWILFQKNKYLETLRPIYTLKWCSVKWIFSIVRAKARSFLLCPILFHRIKIMKRFQMLFTNRCQAMNSLRGKLTWPIVLTTGDKKLKKFCFTKYLFYRIFVLQNIRFTEIYSTTQSTVKCTAIHTEL